MGRTRALGLLLTFLAGFAASVAVFSSLDATAQDGENDKQIRELFRSGVDEFYEGRYEAAYESFNKCLALRPSYELALELRREAGFQFFIEALSQEGDLGFVLRKFLQIIEKKTLIKEPDEARIKQLLEEIKSDDYRKKYMAIENLLSEIGQYCVPYCVETLGDSRDDDYRVDIIVLLWRMEQDAVLPVIEILNSSDSFTRQNAAVVLGNIGSHTALPALLARWEDPEEDEHVKGSAKESVIKITGVKEISSLEAAKELYYKLAEAYYYDDITIIINNYKDWLYWFWVEDEEKPERKLAYRVVDRFEYNELLAEEACYEALALDNAYDNAWTLLLCVLFAELNEVDAALEVMVQKEDIDSVEMDKFQKKRAINEKCQTVCYTRGKEQLYKSLRRSLDDRNALVAVSCINSIRDLKADGGMLPLVPQPVEPGLPPGQAPPPPPPAMGASLIAALNYPDKRVRYAAAEALVFMNPGKPFVDANNVLQPGRLFLDGNKVVPTLIEALGETAPRVILVIENDHQIANRIMEFIREIGYMPVLENNGLNGLTRAKSFPTQDLIIISTDLPDMKAFEIIDALKEDYRTKDTPIFVMAPEARMRVVSGLYAGKSDDVIENKIDKMALRDKLDRAFALPQARQDAPARAIEIARKAAVALGNIDLDNINFDAMLAIGPLEEVLQRGTTDQPRRLDYDVVRLPAMYALGRLGEPARGTLGTLCDIFENDNNKKEIRVGAGDAIGEIIRPRHVGTARVYTVLREGLNDSELEIQNAAAKALGKAVWTPDEYFGVFTDQRPHKNQR
jgi:HEAT repeat protein/DNA-binding response OmpR family regulator